LKKSKIILLCKFLLFFFCLFFIRTLFISKEMKLNYNDVKLTGRIKAISYSDEYTKITISLDGKQISGNLYNSDIVLEYNDLVEITGTLKEIEEKSNFYTFSYKDYLKRHNQFFTIAITDIKLLEKNMNLFYKIKNLIIRRINRFDNPEYLHAFLLGNTSYIDDFVLESYRTNGISHLFSVSGMHLLFFIGIIDKYLKLNSKVIKKIVISIVLIFYSFLVGFTPSVLRASLLYIFNCFIKKPLYSLLLAFVFILLLNPYNLLEIGFQFSFLMSFVLIIFSSKINELTGIKKSIFISTITFIASIPIMIIHFNQINVLTPIYNIFYIPYVSLIVFPLSFLVFVIPSFSGLYSLLTQILGKTSLYLSELDYFIWIMKEPSVLIFILLICFTTLVLYSVYFRRYVWIVIFFMSLYVYHNINYFLSEIYLTVLDVGQGDSLVLHVDRKTLLIDTGGLFYKDIAKYETIPYLKAMGISKVDILVLTHGDYDHMGEAINLVNNFKIEKVIFNCGEFNELEKGLIKVLDKKSIKYYSCIKELNIDDNKIYFLQTKEYDNENDNSNVIYTELDGYKFMFMGDASTITEREILNKYHLPDIDVLKVGHHGSKTSSGKDFIDEINPRYSVISVGKNNRYGHPNKEVLNNLENSKIYRTDQDGSIMFKIKNNKLKIETCSP